MPTTRLPCARCASARSRTAPRSSKKGWKQAAVWSLKASTSSSPASKSSRRSRLKQRPARARARRETKPASRPTKKPPQNEHFGGVHQPAHRHVAARGRDVPDRRRRVAAPARRAAAASRLSDYPGAGGVARRESRNDGIQRGDPAGALFLADRGTHRNDVDEFLRL